jgi:hypothetical protein
MSALTIRLPNSVHESINQLAEKRRYLCQSIYSQRRSRKDGLFSHTGLLAPRGCIGQA